MLIFVLAALAAQAPVSTARPAKPAAPPDIVVQGRPKLVCTMIRRPGSRVGGSRRCVTKEQAVVESEISRQAIQDAVSIQGARNATACGPPTIQSCN